MEKILKKNDYQITDWSWKNWRERTDSRERANTHSYRMGRHFWKGILSQIDWVSVRFREHTSIEDQKALHIGVEGFVNKKKKK